MSSDDSEVTASPIPFDETACGFLDPIGELDLASRRKLLEKSRRLSLRSGEVLLAKDYPWSMLFLLDGSVELKATERGVGRLIKRGQKAFTSPLFAAHAQRQAMATARSDSQILVFDRRLFELLAEHAMTQPHEAGFFEINTVENTLFQDLMAGYQRGCLAIPGVPKITEILSQQVAKTSADTQRLARLIELDPALTVRLIYATKERGKIPSVATAVAQLGVEQVIEIAREFSLNNICQALRAEVRERLVETYRHSIRVAVYSYLLAKQLSHLDHHYAFMLGLLHDVGMFSILCAADRYLDQMAGVDELDALVWKLHGMVGGLVLQSWGFNPAFIKIVEEADEWERDGGAPVDYVDVVLVAQLHSFIGVGERIKGLPKLANIPAFRKIVGDRPGPRFSLQLLQSGRQRMLPIERLLGDSILPDGL